MGLTVGAECEQHQRVSVSICDYSVWGALFCGTVVVVTVSFFLSFFLTLLCYEML